MEFYEINPAFSSNLMLIDEQGQRVTYGDFASFYENVKDKLREKTLLFLFCENSIGSVFFYLACLNKKIVPLLLDVQMNRALAEQLIKTYEPDYIAVPKRLSKQAAPPFDRKPSSETQNSEAATAGLPAAGEPAAEGFGYVVYEQKHDTEASPARDASSRHAAAGTPSADSMAGTALHGDLALLLTTSGSTGSPKLVRQSRKNIGANAASIAEYLSLSSSERPITSLPMQYTYGLSVINSHLLVGAAVLLTSRSLFEKQFWEFFRKEKATSISGVPYTYEILKRLAFFEMELPSLKTMTQAGGKLSPRLHREFAEYAEKTGKNFIVMYGQTEATARMGYLPAADAIAKCGSMGIAIPGGTFRLFNDRQEEILEPDTVGELVYEGENVTMGYARCRADLAKGDERGGILFTGDMARRDADGYYYIAGRKKRFLKLFGKRINMDEIEQLFKAEYDGIDVACAGEDDNMRIFLAGKSREFCRQAEEWIAAKTGLPLSGLCVLPIETIPKNESGKTIYKSLPESCL